LISVILFRHIILLGRRSRKLAIISAAKAARGSVLD